MKKRFSTKLLLLTTLLAFAFLLPQYNTFAGGMLDTIEVDADATEFGESFRIFNVTESGSLTLQNVTLNGNADVTDGNTAQQGGAIYTNGELIIVNSTIQGNSAEQGGAIYVAGEGDATIINSVIAGNSANDGGGIYSEGDLTVTNSTIGGNSASNAGGGINADAVDMQNSIVFGNSAPDGSQISADDADITYSAIQAGWAGEGNITLNADDPVFVDANAGDYHLDPASGLADQGNNDVAQGDTDVDGQARIFGSRIDIGADELQTSYPPPERNLVYQMNLPTSG